MKTKLLLTLLLLGGALVLRGQDTPINEATAAQMTAGTSHNTFVSPARLGATGAINANGWGINTSNITIIADGASWVDGFGLGSASLSEGGLAGNYYNLLVNSIWLSGKTATTSNDGVNGSGVDNVYNRYITGGGGTGGNPQPSPHSILSAATGRKYYIFSGEAIYNSSSAQGYSLATQLSQLQALSDSVHADGANMIWVLCPIPALSSNSNASAITASISSVNAAIANRASITGVQAGDFVVPADQWLTNPADTTLFQGDSIHPTAAGHKVIAAKLLAFLTGDGEAAVSATPTLVNFPRTFNAGLTIPSGVTSTLTGSLSGAGTISVSTLNVNGSNITGAAGGVINLGITGSASPPNNTASLSALAGSTLTIPATGTAGLLNAAGTWTTAQTFNTAKHLFSGMDSVNETYEPMSFTNSSQGNAAYAQMSLYDFNGAYFRIQLQGNGVGNIASFITTKTQLNMTVNNSTVFNLTSTLSTLNAGGANLIAITTTTSTFGSGGTGAWTFFPTTDATSSTAASVTLSGGLGVSKAIVGGTSILSSSSTSGVGYLTGAGAGGTVTQGTNRTTAVTINRITGQITTATNSLAALASATFVVTNSAVAAVDSIILTKAGGFTNEKTAVRTLSVSAGSFSVTVHNIDASTAETGVGIINFAIIKGASN